MNEGMKYQSVRVEDWRIRPEDKFGSLDSVVLNAMHQTYRNFLSRLHLPRRDAVSEGRK